ncbi:12784_t:CDS:1 [Gigaspora margarita]|uniref:12784_t:CDS:1 n=1 Tax=Gigaspora margarita TaxID=4874 RepID=A0ABN7UZC9_GIGMA|nr:12784_t:CDS:1 [Gigaspora margarita]
MAQTLFNHLNNDQKIATKHVYFQNGNQQPTLSGDMLNIYPPYANFTQIKDELDLAIFPNLRKITFWNGCQIGLESINISKNEKLSKILIDSRNDNFIDNNSFTLLVKEIQHSRIILTYYKLIYYGTGSSANLKTSKYLREQTMIPYTLVEDRKLGQLEAEVANLKQSLAQKDQTIAEKDRTIADLNRKAQQTPTLSQFQELNNIALSCTDLEFNKLKQEIKRLKLKDFDPHFQKQKNAFEQLKTTAKDKAGESLSAILELFLQTNKKIIETKNGNNDSFTQGQLQGQLTTCQTLLTTKFTSEELQKLQDKQKELIELEKQSVVLSQ